MIAPTARPVAPGAATRVQRVFGRFSARIAALLLLAVFAALVGYGTTGSSLDVGLRDNTDLVRAVDHARLAGTSRPIRSDEWLVFTPLSIAQSNHTPPFPIVNRQLGPDGQNMLVAGMTGVPVAHLSQLAKPATWGFHVFDLRRALAWYWWLPIFGGLFAVWGVMSVLAPGRWGLGLATAATFVSSGYVVAWSNWPAYTVLFPATAFFLFFRIFQTRHALGLLALGVALGLSLAGFVFVLYPPWQVSLGYLFLFLTAGVAVRERIWARLDARRAVALALSATVAVILVWAWWRDASDAIAAMRATVYPGQRTAVTGGGMALWQAVRGVFNHHSIYFLGATSTNQSEAASFVYLFPVLIAAALVPGLGRRRPGWPELALMAFCLLVLWFQFAGFGAKLAAWSQWGRVPTYRTDLALGLASILLCGATLAATRPGTGRSRVAAAGIALVFALAMLYAAMGAPETAIGPVHLSMWLLIPPFVFLLSYWLLAGDTRPFLLGSLFVTGSMTLPFNPLWRAPTGVVPAAGVLGSDEVRSRRVLVIGSQVEAMGLLAAGVPVANGVFYYPQKSLWRSLDPTGASAAVTNRYQHLSYHPDTTGKVADFKLESPHDDVVRVTFNPTRFDFRLTTAERVLAPNALDLSGNPHLALLGKGQTRTLYRVLPAGQR